MTTSKQSEQALRREVIANDQKQSDATTFFQQAKLSEQLDGSRSKSAVTGAKPYDVPPIPSGPWSSNWCPPMIEEPLGFSVDEVPLCGSPLEIQKSIDALEAQELAGEQAPASEPLPSEAVETLPGHPKRLMIRRIR
jgi:hypothetical protein